MSASGPAPGGEERPDHDLLIEVPDDARELDTEIAAYHREVRIARRRARVARLLLADRWRRAGLTAPVLVGLVVCVIAVMALFVALRPDRAAGPHQESLATATAPVGSVGGLIPDVELTIGGSARGVRALRPAVLALVPLQCECAATIASLARQVGQYALTLYAVAPAGTDPEVDALAGGVHTGVAKSAYDGDGTLAHTYASSGVTVVLLRSDGVVTQVVRDVTASTQLGTGLGSLDRLTG